MSRSSDSMGLTAGSFPPSNHYHPFVKREQHPPLPNMPGNTYELVIGQQPVRARMCGFGDKDRRPITPPPCIRLIVRDENGNELNNMTETDCNFFVLAVDLWDETGTKEQNLVTHPNTSAAALATSTASSPTMPSGFQHHGAYPPMENQYYQSEYQNYPPHGSNPNYPHGYPSTVPPYPPPPPSQMHHSYGQPEEFPGQSGQAPGPFTRNLIGSLTASAFRLQDDNTEWGIWFITQDLSVRTEGTFRLRFSFLNLGLQPNSGDTRRAGVELNRGTSKVLATVMSEPFKVYSAKKFPGMIESTSLSKAFAHQGIRIPVRHGNNEQTGSNGKKASAEPDAEADMEEDGDN